MLRNLNRSKLVEEMVAELAKITDKSTDRAKPTNKDFFGIYVAIKEILSEHPTEFDIIQAIEYLENIQFIYKSLFTPIQESFAHKLLVTFFDPFILTISKNREPSIIIETSNNIKELYQLHFRLGNCLLEKPKSYFSAKTKHGEISNEPIQKWQKRLTPEKIESSDGPAHDFYRYFSIENDTASVLGEVDFEKNVKAYFHRCIGDLVEKAIARKIIPESARDNLNLWLTNLSGQNLFGFIFDLFLQGYFTNGLPATMHTGNIHKMNLAINDNKIIFTFEADIVSLKYGKDLFKAQHYLRNKEHVILIDDEHFADVDKLTLPPVARVYTKVEITVDSEQVVRPKVVDFRMTSYLKEFNLYQVSQSQFAKAIPPDKIIHVPSISTRK